MRFFLLIPLLYLGAASSLSAQAVQFEIITQTCGDRANLRETGLNKTLEVLLPDNTSVILAPGSSAAIDCGEDGIEVTLYNGLVRISGGLTNVGRPILITTSHATLTLFNGSAIVDAEQGQTRAHLLGGDRLLVNNGSVTRRLFRPGFQVIADGGSLGRPSRLTVSQAVADLERLRASIDPTPGQTTPGQSSGPGTGGTPTVVTQTGLGGGGTLPVDVPTAPDTGGGTPSSGFGTELAGLSVGDLYGDSFASTSSGPTESTSISDARSIYNLGIDGGFLGPRLSTYTPGRGGEATIAGGSTVFALLSPGIGGLQTASVGFDLGNGGVGQSLIAAYSSVAFGEEDPLYSVPSTQDAELYYVVTPFNVFGGSSAPLTNNVFNPSVNFDPFLGADIDDQVTSIYIESDGPFWSSALFNFDDPTCGESSFCKYFTDLDQQTVDVGDIVATSGDDSEFSVRFPVTVRISPSETRMVEVISTIDFAAGVFSNPEYAGETGALSSAPALLSGRLPNDPDSFNASVFTPLLGARLYFSADCGAVDCGTLEGLEVVDIAGEAVANTTFTTSISRDEAASNERKAYISATTELAYDIYSQALGDRVTGIAAALTDSDSFFETLVVLFDPTEEELANYDNFIFAEGALIDLGTETLSTSVEVDLFDVGTVGRFQESVRAFGRGATWLELDGCASGGTCSDVITNFDGLASTELAIIYPSQSINFNTPHLNTTVETGMNTEAHSPRLLHLDFGISDVDGLQVMSTSISLGQVALRWVEDRTHYPFNGNFTAEDGKMRGDAFVQGFTIGTSAGVTEVNGQTRPAGSIFFSSDFASSVAGGGNPLIDGGNTGRLGYFVVQNAGTFLDDVVASGETTFTRDTVGTTPSFAPSNIDCAGTTNCNSSTPLSGGTERVVGGGDTLTYGLMRLVAGNESRTVAASGDMSTTFVREAGVFGLDGVVALGAAILQTGGAGGSVGLSFATRDGTLTEPLQAPELTFTNFDPVTNSFAGSLRINGRDLPFGGDQGRAYSAYVDDSFFGAIGHADNDYSFAVYSGGQLVEAGALDPSNSSTIWSGNPNAGATLDRMQTYKHVRWGFFMGDLGNSHANLGNWAGGKPTDTVAPGALAALDGVTGTPVEATYTGHVIGNVYNNGATYVAAGSMTDTFSYGQGAWTGTGSVNFDGREYGLDSRGSSAGDYSATLTGPTGYGGSMTGGFVGAESYGGHTVPGGMAGSFTMRDTGTTYRASGSFGAELSP